MKPFSLCGCILKKSHGELKRKGSERKGVKSLSKFENHYCSVVNQQLEHEGTEPSGNLESIADQSSKRELKCKETCCMGNLPYKMAISN